MSVPVFIDTHAHLHLPDFSRDLPDVLQRARDAGVTRIITIGTDLETSRCSIELAAAHPGVFAAVGWHPSEAHLAPDDLRPALREMAAHPRVVALGETGLDYYWLPSRGNKQAGSADDDAHKKRQAELFTQHLEIAAETGLGVVVHQRDAFEDAMTLLRPWADRVRIVFHCFGSDPDRMREMMTLNARISFTGIVTFKSGDVVRQSVAAVPEDRFMLETDCPYMAPVPHRGQRSEPAHVRDIAGLVAQVRSCPVDEISRMTCATAEVFFPRIRQSNH
jgi:TatD DNase family protein